MTRKALAIGERFGFLTVDGTADSKIDSRGARLYMVTAICDCGTKITVLEASLRNGNTRSCGCARRTNEKWQSGGNRSHGMSKTSTYAIWVDMHKRCKNPRATSYPNYGARGISVCDRWNSFENFLEDMGERPDGHSIERIENNGDYEAKNCIWATRVAQNSNTRRNKFVVLDGGKMTMAQATDKLGVSRAAPIYHMKAHKCTRQEAIDYYAERRKNVAKHQIDP